MPATWLHSHSLLLNAAYDVMFFFWQEKDVELTFTNATKTEKLL